MVLFNFCRQPIMGRAHIRVPQQLLNGSAEARVGGPRRHAGAQTAGLLELRAVIGNSERITHYGHEVKGLVFKWLNRRSQRRSYHWTASTAAWANRKLRPAVITGTPLPRSARQHAPWHA
jgi:hypothetical protein